MARSRAAMLVNYSTVIHQMRMPRARGTTILSLQVTSVHKGIHFSVSVGPDSSLRTRTLPTEQVQSCLSASFWTGKDFRARTHVRDLDRPCHPAVPLEDYVVLPVLEFCQQGLQKVRQKGSQIPATAAVPLEDYLVLPVLELRQQGLQKVRPKVSQIPARRSPLIRTLLNVEVELLQKSILMQVSHTNRCESCTSGLIVAPCPCVSMQSYSRCFLSFPGQL